MPIIEIDNLEAPGLDVYASLTEHQLRYETPDNGLFIAESPKVIRVALSAGYEPVSMLCEKKHITGDASDLINACPGLLVYTGSRELLRQLTGYTLTRGVLCAMKRKPTVDAELMVERSKRIAVIEAVCDTTNIGSIFRSAAALGIDGVLLTPDSCDPLNRRSIRVSMGTVFKVNWTFCHNPVEILKKAGFTTVALALTPDALPLDDPILKNIDKLALVLGTEGEGLTEATLKLCDYKAVIPMHKGVDSLNVGVAAGIAFWTMRLSNIKEV